MVDRLSSMLIDGMGRTVVDDGSGVTEHRLFAPLPDICTAPVNVNLYKKHVYWFPALARRKKTRALSLAYQKLQVLSVVSQGVGYKRVFETVGLSAYTTL